METKEGNVIVGYAIRFGKRSRKLGNFFEVIDSSALNEADLSNVKCLVDHDTSKVLGSVKNKTLELSVDDVGLKFKVILPETTYANDLYKLVERGDIDGCSFGFAMDEKNRAAQTVSRIDTDVYLRRIHKIARLKEISIVSMPAYDSTTATIKRDFDNVVEQFELEKLNTELEFLTIT